MCLHSLGYPSKFSPLCMKTLAVICTVIFSKLPDPTANLLSDMSEWRSASGKILRGLRFPPTLHYKSPTKLTLRAQFNNIFYPISSTALYVFQLVYSACFIFHVYIWDCFPGDKLQNFYLVMVVHRTIIHPTLVPGCPELYAPYTENMHSGATWKAHFTGK
jgi:hypothetical protein